MSYFDKKIIYLLLLSLTILSSCGGGGGGSSTNNTSNNASLPSQSVYVNTYSSDSSSYNIDSPTITVYINNQPFKLLLDTAQSGITILQTSLQSAGINLSSSTLNQPFSILYGDQSTSTGYLSSANVTIGNGNPTTQMNIGVITGGTAFPSPGGIVGDFGVGMGQSIIGSTSTNAPDYMTASNLLGFILDCSNTQEGGTSPFCILTTSNTTPLNATILSVASSSGPYPTINFSFGNSVNPPIDQEPIDTGTNFQSFSSNFLYAASPQLSFDNTCNPFNGINSSVAGYNFVVSSGSVSLNFVTTRFCDFTNNGLASNNWLASGTSYGIWGMPLILGHSWWFTTGSVSFIK